MKNRCLITLPSAFCLSASPQWHEYSVQSAKLSASHTASEGDPPIMKLHLWCARASCLPATPTQELPLCWSTVHVQVTNTWQDKTIPPSLFPVVLPPPVVALFPLYLNLRTSDCSGVWTSPPPDGLYQHSSIPISSEPFSQSVLSLWTTCRHL